MPANDDFDPLIYYYRALTPGAQERVRAGAARRAHDLRAQALRDFFGRMVAWWRRRAAAAQLREFDDRTLKDMGLHRSEIETAVREGKPDRFVPASARRPLPPMVEVVKKTEAPARIAA